MPRQSPWEAMPRLFVPLPAPSTKPLPSPTNADAQIRVVSYNILADCYIDVFRRNPNGSDEFRRCLEWEYRRELVIKEIKDYNPDIIALQEVEEPFFHGELSTALATIGLTGHFLPRGNDVRGRAGVVREGIALFWRHSAFDVVDVQSAYFSKMPLPPPMSDPAAPASLVNTAERADCLGEGMVYATLRERRTGRTLVACGTHLWWNPTNPDLKLLQMYQLLQRVAETAKKAAAAPPGADVGQIQVPIVICGDFNSLPAKFAADPFDPHLVPGQVHVSGVYELATKGRVEASNADHFARRGAPEYTEAVVSALPPLSSANATAFGHELPISTRTISGFHGTLDYVFYAGPGITPIQVLDLPYDVRAAGPNPADERTQSVLPNAHFPSDHLAVGATFLLQAGAA